MTRIIDPAEIARNYRTAIREEIRKLPAPLRLAGFLSAETGPSQTYANYTRIGCEDVGIRFDITQADKLAVESAIDQANADSSVHGIIVYYPIFGSDHDTYIRNLVDYRKDIEGLNAHWARRMYHNQRYIDAEKTKKSILPCTPLAILKLVKEAGVPTEGKSPLAGRRITIFNRSEVVGRPLAYMLANDGAEVFSFDIDGPLLFHDDKVAESRVTRAEALAQSDIVITGVPSRDFPLVSAREIRKGTVCINFSTYKNFADDIIGKAGVFVPRVGPMTVTMALRNTLRLFHNFHSNS